MASLEWDRCYQLAIPTFALSLGAFGFSQTQWARPGGAMTWQAEALQIASAGFLCAALVLTVLFVVRSPIFRRWRQRKLPFLTATVAAAILLIGAVLLLPRLPRITELQRGALFGVSATLLLEGLFRIGFRYYLRRMERHKPENDRLESERAEIEAARAALREDQATIDRENKVANLRRAYKPHFFQAFIRAEDILSTLCSSEQASTEHHHIAHLVREFLLPRFRSAIEGLESYLFIPRPLTAVELEELQGRFVGTLREYIVMVNELKSATLLMRGEQGLRSVQGITELFRYNQGCYEALRKVDDNGDIYIPGHKELKDIFPNQD